MKKNKQPFNKKYILSFVSCLTVCSSTLIGCDNTETATAPSNSSTAQAQDYSLPIVSDGSVTLTVATNDNYYTPKSYAQNLPVWQEIEKKTGVKIKWEVAPSSQYTNTINVRMAAAQGLPDLIRLPNDPVKPASDGLIIPMDDLIAKYAPNIRKYFSENPAIKKMMQAPDGKIYALSSDVSGTTSTDPFGLIINQTWLDKLGLKEPQTLDDWYTVLKAFKEKDPNGNGKQDEIPISTRFQVTNGSSISGLFLFGSAMGLHLNYSDGFYPDKNGKIQYEWIDPRAKELVVWLNKLYKEGLIDPQFMMKTDDDIISGISRNVIGVTNHFLNNANRFTNAQKQAGIQNANWQMTLPPSGPGTKGFYEKYGPLSGWLAISKDCKNPEVAIKWLDYIYASEEGNRYVSFGIEGQSYKMVDGEPQFTEWTSKNPDGLDVNDALRSIGAMPVTVWIRSEKGPWSRQTKAVLNLLPDAVKQAEKLKDSGVDAIPLGLTSVEEVEATTAINADIQTYKAETLTKFITGQAPIDWEKYVSTMKSMGINKLIEVKQKQYDRVMK
ncbi:extracellular solute-binding protein [Paenibacillus filicis]|uniref:Extracellular solute-binding protein n=1 Tax=Paenibacillus gyeongsangnamensis TaxID=3388067 RepID=A0ABT4Q5R4_9BACL|nr:extracellular solute-binding protein [Paenibacillus filicis]MCZ8512159.1 extracellular solute-binding protein [Paenibacillus filicis]